MKEIIKETMNQNTITFFSKGYCVIESSHYPEIIGKAKIMRDKRG